MGYEVEFIYEECHLEVTRSELESIMKSLESESGPGEVKLKSGITYGGTNYTLNDLRINESDDNVSIEAYRFEMKGHKVGQRSIFNHIECESKWIVGPTIEVMKGVFKEYNGTLTGYYRGEDGEEWGYFIVRNGVGVSRKTLFGEDRTEKNMIMVDKIFQDKNRDLLTAFAPRILGNDSIPKEYNVKLDGTDHVVDIPMIAKEGKNRVLFLLMQEEWNQENAQLFSSQLTTIKKSKYCDDAIYLISGYPVPKNIEDQLISPKENKESQSAQGPKRNTNSIITKLMSFFKGK